MKIKKYNESNDFDLSYEISEMFFSECDNFASDDSSKIKNVHVLMFYFIIIEEEELTQILECDKFIKDKDGLYLTSESNNYSDFNVKLVIKLRQPQFDKLVEHMKIIKSSKKYNL